MPTAAYLRILPHCEPGDERWGVKSLVELVDRAARATARDFPGTRTTVGDFSRREGGDIDGHASHESGRDADILFFSKDPKGKTVYHDGFVAYGVDGNPKNVTGAFRFDDARTWALVKHFLTDPQVRVSRIFIASYIRARLLRQAQSIGESIEMRERAAEIMVEPAGVLPHDDHFHLRIACPDNGTGCVESAMPRKRKPAARSRGAAQCSIRGHAHSSGASHIDAHPSDVSAGSKRPEVPMPPPSDAQDGAAEPEDHSDDPE